MVSFSSTNTESVWELDEHRFVYIVEPPQRGGYGVIRVSVDTIWTSVSPGSPSADPARTARNVWQRRAQSLREPIAPRSAWAAVQCEQAADREAFKALEQQS